jgi:hypothetical protein
MSKQQLSTLPTDFSINSEDGGGLRLTKNTKIICDVDSFFMIKNENEDISVLTQDERLYSTDPLPKETTPAIRLGNENQDSLDITPEKDINNVVLPDRTQVELLPIAPIQPKLLPLPDIEQPIPSPVRPNISVKLNEFEEANFLPEDENQQTFNIYDTAIIYKYDPITDSNIPRETIKIEVYNNLTVSNAFGNVSQYNSNSIKTALNSFISNGFTKAQAAGIVGVLLGESGLNPKKNNKESYALGIAQFLGYKVGSELYDFLNEFGLSTTYSTKPSDRPKLLLSITSNTKYPTLQQQLDYLNKRLKTKYSGVVKAIKNTTIPAEAALKFVKGYEIPGAATKKYYDDIQQYANTINKDF